MKEYLRSKHNLQGKTVDQELFQKVVDFYKDRSHIEVVDVYQVPDQVLKDLELLNKYRVILYDNRTKLHLECGCDNQIGRWMK